MLKSLLDVLRVVLKPLAGERSWVLNATISVRLLSTPYPPHLTHRCYRHPHTHHVTHTVGIMICSVALLCTYQLLHREM